MGHNIDKRAVLSDTEVLTVAVLVAKYFHNYHERALRVLKLGGYVGPGLSISRFNRRLHALIVRPYIKVTGCYSDSQLD